MNPQIDADEPTSVDTSDRVASDSYDPHMIPAETAARMEREGNLYKTLPTEEQATSELTDDQTNVESIHTTSGYTVDQEGLLNNYAIEPEMYYEVPGDAHQVIEEDRAERIAELAEMNQDHSGDLTIEEDVRGRGPGFI